MLLPPSFLCQTGKTLVLQQLIPALLGRRPSLLLGTAGDDPLLFCRVDLLMLAPPGTSPEQAVRNLYNHMTGWWGGIADRHGYIPPAPPAQLEIQLEKARLFTLLDKLHRRFVLLVDEVGREWRVGRVDSRQNVR